MITKTHAETSDNNMLFAAGLYEKGVLVDLNPEVSEEFLKDVDVEELFKVNQRLNLDEDLDKAIKDVRASLPESPVWARPRSGRQKQHHKEDRRTLSCSGFKRLSDAAAVANGG